MIKSLKAKEILDSRGKTTVEVELETEKGVFRASVPSGTSEGKYEAKEVKASKAVKNVNRIITPKLFGKDPSRQKEIDELMIELDGTENKSKLGANAILAVSLAVCRAGAKAKNLPLYQYIKKLYRGPSSGNFARGRASTSLPTPSVLLIEGGLHAQNKLDFQEFMVVAEFEQAKKVYQKLGKILKTGTGIEGGFAPQISEPEEALDLIMQVADGYDMKIGVDCAASHFRKNKYRIDFYQKLVRKYPIIFLEDPFPQNDWQNWQKLNSKFKIQNSKLLIVADDLTATNPERIKLAKRKNACGGVVIKPDQIGTVTETLEAVKLAKSYGWKIMVSHRSGETRDDFIADLAVGVGADFIKSGAPSQPERLVKYNRLQKIEKELK